MPEQVSPEQLRTVVRSFPQPWIAAVKEPGPVPNRQGGLVTWGSPRDKKRRGWGEVS